MGTRNITRIVLDDEIKVSQYCQWDGYPTYAGKEILEFIKENDMELFKEQVRKTTLTITADGVTSFYTGYPLREDVVEASNLYNEIIYNSSGGALEKRKEEARERVEEELGLDTLLSYLIASRDTGCEVLRLILEFDNLSFYTTRYLLGDTDWQIEAINTLDLDTNQLIMQWHDKVLTISFDDIPGMDIEKEMQEFEKEEDDDE